MDNNKKPFSKRHGYRSAPKEITIWEDAPETLRHFVLDTAVKMEFGPNRLRRVICPVLHVRPDPNNWTEYPNVWDEVQDLVYGCDWFLFYDFVEALYRALSEHLPEDTSFGPGYTLGHLFQDALNEFFVDEGIGWQMVDGEIITRGTETFESNIHSAVEALGAANRLTAQNEIHEAIGDLSRRPEADLTGAIQHAMAALECVARDVCGDEKATLGEVIKRYPNTIPKPLDESVSKAWGFASEMARHIREGRNPERKEVELIVGLAATVATYLSR
ncbi:MAG: hypothetical protein IT318_23000 [Anaerolineales bacterium]|nr:hypothetical protein [Anaerolineales bacterium]